MFRKNTPGKWEPNVCNWVLFFNIVLVEPCYHSSASVRSFSVYGKGGKLDKAVEIFVTAQELGLPIDEKMYTNMINLYGKAGQVLSALPRNQLKTFCSIFFWFTAVSFYPVLRL